MRPLDGQQHMLTRARNIPASVTAVRMNSSLYTLILTPTWICPNNKSSCFASQLAPRHKPTSTTHLVEQDLLHGTADQLLGTLGHRQDQYGECEHRWHCQEVHISVATTAKETAGTQVSITTADAHTAGNAQADEGGHGRERCVAQSLGTSRVKGVRRRERCQVLVGNVSADVTCSDGR